jgi:ubiquinone biosynthesis protein UbiJ
MTKASTRVAGKVIAAAVAVVVALLLMPYVRDVIDALGAGEDDVDSTVSTLIEWLFALALAILIYSAIVAVPTLVTRRRAGRQS